MKYYFTFGSGQAHENCYHVVDAPDAAIARALMHNRFGNKWSMQYESREKAGVDKFNLAEIDVAGVKLPEVVIEEIQLARKINFSPSDLVKSDEDES